MLEINKDSCGSSQQRSGALSRWDNKGGAGPTGPQQRLTLNGKQPDVPPITDVEIVQLRVRVIALENLVIAFLAHSSDPAQATAHQMADYILPKPDATDHRLTTNAGTHMIDLLERSKHFRNV